MIHALLTIGWFVLICLLIRKWSFFRFPGVNRSWIIGIFGLKVAVGLALWAIYTYHYTYRETSDAFRYFDDAMVILGMLKDHPDHFFRFLFGIGLEQADVSHYFDQMGGWTSAYSYGIINDNPTIIRLNVIIGLFSFGHYHVHTVWMCFLSLLGGMGFLRGIIKIKKVPVLAALIAAFLIPGVLFWSSGVLKEAPLVGAIGLLFYQLVMWLEKRSVKRLIWIMLLTIGLLFLKGYIILLMTPAILFLLLVPVLPFRSWQTFLMVHVVVGAIAFSGWFYPAGDFFYVLEKKQTDFVNVAELQNAGSFIDPLPIGTVGDALLTAPAALYRTYFRPDWRDLSSSFHIMAFAENILLLILVLTVIYFFKRPDSGETSVLLFCASVFILIGLVIGWTVPILGAIVRYKIPALIFVVIAALILIDFEKMKTRKLR